MKARLAGMALVCGLWAAAAGAEDIAQVLERSQQTRLATWTPASEHTPEVLALQESFAKLKEHHVVPDGVELRVVAAGTFAETVQGRLIVVHASVGAMPALCRMFVLAHESGHVALGHWDARVGLYRQFIPGSVEKAHTDPVAAALGRAASVQAQTQELQADAYAIGVMLDLGYGEEDLIEMFKSMGNRDATATHPSVAQRIAQLRAIGERHRSSPWLRAAMTGG